jgi:hypothetical protein
VKTYTTKSLGEVIDGLEVQAIIGYDNAPVYSCRCLECGTKGITVRHQQFTNGTSRCTSSIHGRAEVKPSSSSSAEVRSRDDGWSEYYAAKLRQPAEQPKQPHRDPETEAWLKTKADAKQRRTEEIRAEYRRFYAYAFMHDWNMQKFVSLKQWFNLSDHHRAQVLERHVKEDQK